MIKLSLFFSIVLLTFSVSAKTYVVGFPNNDFYPQYEQGPDNKAIGFLPELLKKFASDHKLKFEFRFLPIKRYLEFIKSGKIDFIMPDNKDWALEAKAGQQYIYSNRIMDSQVSIIVKRSNEFISVEQLKSIGTISGYTIHKLDSEISSKQISVSYNNNPDGLLKQVSLGRIDGAYFHSDIALHLAKKLDKDLVIAKSLPNVDYSYHFSTIRHPEIIKQFNLWLEANSEWIEQQRQGHFNPKQGLLAPLHIAPVAQR